MNEDKLVGLHPTLVKAHHTMSLAMRSFDIILVPIEGVRSHERQAELYAQGRTTPGAIVTHSPAGEGKHEQKIDGYGHALDYGMKDVLRPERGLWDSAHPWQLFGFMAKRLGLIWGGDFKSIKGDYGHVEVAE